MNVLRTVQYEYIRTAGYGRLLFPVAINIQSPYIHESFVRNTQRIQVLSTTYSTYVQVASLYLRCLDEISSHCDISGNVSDGIPEGIPSPPPPPPPPPTSPVPSLAQFLMDSVAPVMPLALISGPAAGLPLDHDHAHIHDPDPDPEPCLGPVPSPSPLSNLRI